MNAQDVCIDTTHFQVNFVDAGLCPRVLRILDNFLRIDFCHSNILVNFQSFG